MTYEERLALAVGQAARKEQDDVITLLVAEHAGLVYRVAYSVLKDSSDAEDVTQETFVRVMKNAGRLPLIRDRRAWLARIAWRLALTRWNRTRKRRRHEIECVGDSSHLIATRLPSPDSDEAVALIERMAASLPDHLRHALMLSAIDELSAREVAETLNISEGTVRTRVHRARKMLREKLENLLGSEYVP